MFVKVGQHQRLISSHRQVYSFCPAYSFCNSVVTDDDPTSHDDSSLKVDSRQHSTATFCTWSRVFLSFLLLLLVLLFFFTFVIFFHHSYFFSFYLIASPYILSSSSSLPSHTHAWNTFFFVCVQVFLLLFFIAFFCGSHNIPKTALLKVSKCNHLIIITFTSPPLRCCFRVPFFFILDVIYYRTSTDLIQRAHTHLPK